MERKIRAGLLIVVLVAAFVLFSGCNGGTPNPPPEFGIKDVSVNQHRASIGDTIEFSWNFEKPEELQKQWIEIDSLTIRGKLFRSIMGCSPETPQYPCLSNDVRERPFNFTGPVTVVIVGQSNDNKIVKAAFDVMLPESSYFKADLMAIDGNTKYPGIYLPATGVKSIEFPIYFGIYEDIDNNNPHSENFIINQLDALPNIEQVMPKDHAFLGRSYNDTPENNFDYQEGRAFPLLDSDYLLNNLDAIDHSTNKRFTEMGYTHADGMIIAAKISYDGKITKTRDRKNNTEFDVVTGDLSFEPVFMQIDLRSEQGGNLHVVDMHIGNIPQGFVASGYTGITMGRYVAAGGYNVPYELPQQNRQYKIMNLKEGMVKDSKLGFNAYGTGSYVEVSNVYWNNVPLYSDYDLGGVLKLDIRDHT